MVNALNHLVQGFSGGISGFISGVVIDAFLPVFSALNVPPIFWVAIIVVIAVDFVSGIVEAYSFGLLYSIGVMSAGFLVSDLGTILLGALSVIGLILSRFL
jgi:ABC-type antimicrobial peptide transport system permease subunit